MPLSKGGGFWDFIWTLKPGIKGCPTSDSQIELAHPPLLHIQPMPPSDPFHPMKGSYTKDPDREIRDKKAEVGTAWGFSDYPAKGLLVLRGSTATASRASQRLLPDPAADSAPHPDSLATKSRPVIGGLLGSGVLGPSSPPASHRILKDTSR